MFCHSADLSELKLHAYLSFLHMLCYPLPSTPMQKINHRITEWFGLEWTSKIIWFQSLCNGQGHLPLELVAQSLIQPSLEHFQGVVIRSFSRQLVPVPHHLHSK